MPQWKLYRKAILRCIDGFLENLCGQTMHDMVDDMPEKSTDVMYNNILPVFSKLYDCLRTTQRHGAVILVIDDNMYYASMRYQLCQLARRCE